MDIGERIKRDEGFRDTVYPDSLGYPTVGWGHMDPNLIIGTKYSKKQLDKFFEDDLKQAKKDARTYMGDKAFDKLHPEQQDVLYNMSFNMGLSKMSKFKKLKRALQQGDAVEAAKQMKNSKWYGQVGDRSKRLISQMLGTSSTNLPSYPERIANAINKQFTADPYREKLMYERMQGEENTARMRQEAGQALEMYNQPSQRLELPPQSNVPLEDERHPYLYDTEMPRDTVAERGPSFYDKLQEAGMVNKGLLDWGDADLPQFKYD